MLHLRQFKPCFPTKQLKCASLNLSMASDHDLHVWDGIVIARFAYWKGFKQRILSSDFVSRLCQGIVFKTCSKTFSKAQIKEQTVPRKTHLKTGTIGSKSGRTGGQG